MKNIINTHIWECVELEFCSVICYANPFQEVELQVEFLGPNGEKLLVPGFWDGGTLWKVRFAPIAAGEWSWKSICTNIADNGLHGKTGIGIFLVDEGFGGESQSTGIYQGSFNRQIFRIG